MPAASHVAPACLSEADASPPTRSRLDGLYVDHHGWLLAWLQRKLGNQHDAADLAQDTFVRILAGRDLQAIQQPRAYLATVARGLLVNWCQRQALERAYLQALAALPEPQAPSPEQRLLILQTLHQVDAMLDTLPAAARRAFLLSQIEGLGYDEIARRLGLSLSTVKRHMKLAFVHCLALVE
ncbi:sigma-70 family RNA polymerase sigma factor [Rubrivivax gelatinosus]|uniref:RNA polymerase sigma-70 factor (ECF subfamily) n=1 Tax=Rubrivivax gelatinosus TaxID=28068 RepID=A0A4R2MAX1_RUBGE|nr:sigma-70 family RNA polymerase sigma factor [Rubrivivax gelatinosus]MBK1686804.1 RNA polymerase subunit sigma [Rubrivivax gelatinosus]TCP01494.1 RNA polymerase sigma-70 factor (ECF subfamily) [Rubrivivax gelatinosus]